MATPLTGLTDQEGVQRQALGLGNQAAIPTSRSYAQILRENVFTFINNVLFALGAALVLLGRPSDALVSVGVIFINVIVSVVQEIRAKRTLDKIALVTRPTATVIRDGQEKIVDPSALVVGDLCVVRPGDQVVVDGVVVGDGKMDVDESLLTGESDHIPKMAGNEVFSGSFCVTGSAVYEAQKVGVNSLANQLTTSARAFRRVLTPLQQEINLSVRVILIVAVYFEMLLVINGILNRIPVVDSVKIAVVIADSGVRHSLASNSAYNNRRAACEEAVRILKPVLPEISVLRDVSPAKFIQYQYLLTPEIRKRARHVVEECARVDEAAASLEAGDIRHFGKLMYDGHASLRDYYEVSSPELDALVEIAASIEGCYGARLTGAGVGGCTVNLVEDNVADQFIQLLKEGYQQKVNRKAEVYLCHASQGVHVAIRS